MSNQQPITSSSIFGEIGKTIEAQPWLAKMRDSWPASIGSEVEQLLAMLAQGLDAGGILMQVRDTAEVLLKTLTLVAAADLIAHGTPDTAIIARKALFSGTLSLGNSFKVFILCAI